MLLAVQPSIVPRVSCAKNAGVQKRTYQSDMRQSTAFKGYSAGYIATGGLIAMALTVLYSIYANMHGLCNTGMTLNWPS